MTKRALVIGSQVDGLSGVDNDLRAIAERLRERGFLLDVRSGVDATRAGITDGYARLIQDSAASDVSVVYFSGHGCRIESTARENRYRRVNLCLVPTDWTACGPFRGIVDIELSTWMSRLTQRTKNVACIFDCCHAATISRAAEFNVGAYYPKFTLRTPMDSFQEFLAGLQLDPALSVESNPHAVRLGAAEADRAAYEADHELQGETQRMGRFTWALSTVLDELKAAPISWRGLMARVRELVMRCTPEQRPQTEGPAERLLFSLESTRRSDAVVFFRDEHGQPMLRASRLLGAAPGVVYDLLPQTAVEYDRSCAFATATVLENVRDASRVSLELTPMSREPQIGDLAFPRRHPFPQLSLSVLGQSQLAEHARTLVQSSRFLREAEQDEPPNLQLSEASDVLTLSDGDGRTIASSWCATPSGVAVALNVAERWSRSRALRALESEGFAANPIEVRWGRVESGERVPFCSGDMLHVGDRVYIDVKNTSSESLWLAIFDLGVTGKITLLTSATPTGRKLGPEGSSEACYTLGASHEILSGFGPGALPADAPPTVFHPETFLVVVSTYPADFFTLEALGTKSASHTTRAFGLSAWLEAVQNGSTRDFAIEESGSRYRIEKLDFTLAATKRWPPCGKPRGVLASVGPRDSRKLKQLTAADLRPGDILLSLGGSAVSNTIRGFDGGWYSHAALWSGVDVIEATDPNVQRNSLEQSITAGARKYVDVYRHRKVNDVTSKRIVDHALDYVGRTYAWGDLWLAGLIVSSGAFLFRSELKQLHWLQAMQSIEHFLQLGSAHAGELITCVGLVCRSYLAADVLLEIDLQGLRRYEGVEVASAVAELAKHHIFPTGKGGADEVLATVARFQDQIIALTGAPPQVLVPHEVPLARGTGSTFVIGQDWGTNLVTPRDLMQSASLDLIGCIHPCSP